MGNSKNTEQRNKFCPTCILDIHNFQNFFFFFWKMVGLYWHNLIFILISDADIFFKRYYSFAQIVFRVNPIQPDPSHFNSYEKVIAFDLLLNPAFLSIFSFLSDLSVSSFVEIKFSIVKNSYNQYYSSCCDLQLLDEMIDNGFPLTTEPNILRDMIAPPNIVSKMLSVVTGNTSNVSDTLPGATSSCVPWRTTQLKHANNDVYVNLVEEMDTIINRHARIIFLEFLLSLVILLYGG